MRIFLLQKQVLKKKTTNKQNLSECEEVASASVVSSFLDFESCSSDDGVVVWEKVRILFDFAS